MDGPLRGLAITLAIAATVLSDEATASAQTSRPADEQRYLETPPGEKPRVVITADPELDDANSLIRYLLYSPDFQTEGLIYASSQFHWTGDGKGTEWFVPGREYSRFGVNLCPCTTWRWAPDERFIDDAVDAYAAAYPNLRLHEPDYPAPEALRSTVRWGNVEFDGDISKDTPGSDLIKSLLLDDEPSPVYLHAWGGQSTIARALKSIEEQYKGTPEWQTIRKRVISKAVIHPSGDQDDTYVRYIQPFWPEIRYREQTGGIPLAYNPQARVSEQDAAYFSPEWTRTNISQRGPLGALYRVWGDGKQMVEGDIFDYFGIAGKSEEVLRRDGYIVWTPVQPEGSFLGEGDTGTFLNLLNNGLRGYRGDSFGGWGGYAASSPGGSFASAFTGLEATVAGQAARPARAADNSFLAAAQNDFAARFAWATTPRYGAANHPPRISADGARAVSARPGQELSLRVSVSDPDKNAVRVRWWRWSEADSYAGPVPLSRTDGRGTSLTIPNEAKPGETIHLIAEATDSGAPPLTRYERIVIEVVQ